MGLRLPAAVQVLSRRRSRSGGKRVAEERTCILRHGAVKKQKLASLADCSSRRLHSPIKGGVSSDSGLVAQETSSDNAKSTRSLLNQHRGGQGWEGGCGTVRWTAPGRTQQFDHIQRKLLSVADCQNRELRSATSKDEGLVASGTDKSLDSPTRITRSRLRQCQEGQERIEGGDIESYAPGQAQIGTSCKEKLLSVISCHERAFCTRPSVRFSDSEELVDRNTEKVTEFPWRITRSQQGCRQEHSYSGGIDTIDCDAPGSVQGREEDSKMYLLPVADDLDEELFTPTFNGGVLKDSRLGTRSRYRSSDFPSRTTRSRQTVCPEEQELEGGLFHDESFSLDDGQNFEPSTRKVMLMTNCTDQELSPIYRLGVPEDEGLVAKEADRGSNSIPSRRVPLIDPRKKKFFQVLRNGVQKPKRLALKQLLVRLPPIQKSVEAVDPITSNSGKFMSLKDLHAKFTLKRQETRRVKECKGPRSKLADQVVTAVREISCTESEVAEIGKEDGDIGAGVSGKVHPFSDAGTVEASCTEQLEVRVGMRNGFRLLPTTLSEASGGESRETKVPDTSQVQKVTESVESDLVVELHIPEPQNVQKLSKSLEDRGDKGLHSGILDGGDVHTPQGSRPLHVDSVVDTGLDRRDRLCKRWPQTVKLAEALQKYNVHKAKVCQWKEFELGGILPTSLIGQSCKVYWPLDDEWYTGVIGDYNEQIRKHWIIYQDSEREWAILAKERVKLKISAAEKLRLSLEPEEHTVEGKKRPDPDELAALAVTMEDYQEEPSSGDLVWAKVKGYPMWPAYVMDEEHARACGLEPTTHDDMLAVQFFGSYDHARIVSRNVVLFSKGLLAKYHCKCKRVAFDQGLQEVEVYFKECRLPERMAHLHVESPKNVGGIERKRRHVEGDDHDFMGDERQYTIRKSVKSLFTLPLKLGTLVVLNLGKVVRDSEHFHNQNYIWTEGYTSVRKFTLSREPDSAVEYKMEIVRNPTVPSLPLFRVTPTNEMSIEGSSPSVCWKKLLSKLKKAEAKVGKFANPDNEKRRRFRSGAAMFGFSNPRVAKLIQGLPHSRTCSKYTGWLDKPPVEEGQEDLLPAGYKPVEVQWKHLDRCTICYLDGEYVDNLLLQCDKCRIMVHMNCYGEVQRPNGDLWLCSLCDAEAPKKRPLCCLCPVTSGGMKRTTDGRWVHIACTIWISEAHMADAKNMVPVDCLNGIHKDQWNFTCSICRVPYGACIQCGDSHCRVAYHPLCARASSFRMEAVEELKKGGEVSLRVTSYCRKHRKPKAQIPINTARSLPRDCSAFQPPTNPSGCARSEPYNPAMRLSRREPEAQAAALAKRHFVENMPFIVSGCRGKVPEQQESVKVWSWHSEANMTLNAVSPVISPPDVHQTGAVDTVVFSMPEKFCHMISSLYQRLTFGKSAIHRWGVFSKQTHQANDMIIEYAGEVVRPIVADLREARCDESLVGAGTYMFRVDDERVVDATQSGSLAHLINHSCEPNCYSRLVSVRGKDRIIIFAKRKIVRGEEVTYDYRFMSKDERLDCCCGSPSCRGTVNILDDGSEASMTLVPLKDLTKVGSLDK